MKEVQFFKAPRKSKLSSFFLPRGPKKNKRLKQVTFFKPKRIPPSKRSRKLLWFKDADKDKIPNFLDCRPYNPKKHDTYPRWRRKTFRKYGRGMERVYRAGEEAIAKEEFRFQRRMKQGRPLTKQRKARVVKEGFYRDIGTPELSRGYGDKPVRFRKRLIVDKTEPKGNRVKGYISTLATRKKGVRELDTIYVEPKERKKGYGKKAIRDMLKDPKTEKFIAKAIVEDEKDKEKWEKLGAKPISKEEYEELSITTEADKELPEELKEEVEEVKHYVEIEPEEEENGKEEEEKKEDE